MNARFRSILAGAMVILAGGGAGGSSPTAAQQPAKGSTQPKPGTSAAATMTVQNTCEFTVTYTWSGLKGRNLIASVGLYYRNGQLDVGVTGANWNFEGQAGASGSVSHTFVLTANASGARQILGRGDLVDSRRYQRIDGSVAGTTAVTSTCG